MWVRRVSLTCLRRPTIGRFYCNKNPYTINNPAYDNRPWSEIKEPSSVKQEEPKEKIPKTKETELAKHLKDIIRTKGPISVAHYIREALTNEKYGYYTCKSDVLGKEGDFITAPELSQMFGELIGIWVAQIASMYKKTGNSLRIVEIGPGKGTLSADLIRAIQRTSDVKEIHLHLIEASPILRRKQAEALQCDETAQSVVGDPAFVGDEIGNYKSKTGITVNWHRDISQLTGDDPIFFIGQEFLDALPVQVFEYSNKVWREVCVADDDSPYGHHFRYVLSKVESPNSLALERYKSLVLPSSYIPVEGDRIEISIARTTFLQAVGDLLSTRGGIGLFIDYGHNRFCTNSLRAIKAHKFTDILCEPGECDITSDVDFSHVRRVFEQVRDDAMNNLLKVFGPVTQGGFLKEIGIQSRLLQILAQMDDDEQIENVTSAYTRLVDPQEMGFTYKVLAVTPNSSEFSSDYLIGFPGTKKH